MVSRSILTNPYNLSQFSTHFEEFNESSPTGCSRDITPTSVIIVIPTQSNIEEKSSQLHISSVLSLPGSPNAISSVSSAMSLPFNVSHTFNTLTTTTKNYISDDVLLSTSTSLGQISILSLTSTKFVPIPSSTEHFHDIISDVEISSSPLTINLTSDIQNQGTLTQPLMTSSKLSIVKDIYLSDQEYIIEEEQNIINKV